MTRLVHIRLDPDLEPYVPLICAKERVSQVRLLNKALRAYINQFGPDYLAELLRLQAAGALNVELIPGDEATLPNPDQAAAAGSDHKKKGRR